MGDFDYDTQSDKKGHKFTLDKKGIPPLHYYGDNVRRFFIAGAIVMLIGLPFFEDYIRVPAFYYILGMIFLGLVAGFTNPTQHWVVVLNVAISVFAIYFFESETIEAFKTCDTSTGKWYFLTNQLLAVIFLAALYYASKTVRGTWFRHRKLEE